MTSAGGQAFDQEPSMPGPKSSWRLARSASPETASEMLPGKRRENHDLKELVADLSLEVYRFKETAIPALENASV